MSLFKIGTFLNQRKLAFFCVNQRPNLISDKVKIGEFVINVTYN